MKKNIIIGIDIGGTSIKSGLYSLKLNKFLSKNVIDTGAHLDKKHIISNIKISVEKLLKETKKNIGNVIGIGIGSPGIVKNNVIVGNAENFKNWNGTDLNKAIGTFYNIPIKSNNDVNIAISGEYHFSTVSTAGNYNNIFMITLGTGIGGGIIINGNLYSGGIGAAGEVGHIKIIPEGRLCTCNARGCWETYASATGLIKTINENPKLKNKLQEISVLEFFKLVKKKEDYALEVLERYIEHLSMGLGNCINILNPEVVIIGGGLANSYNLFINLLKQKLKKYTLPIPLKNCKIKKAQLTNDAGIFGAVSLFL